MLSPKNFWCKNSLGPNKFRPSKLIGSKNLVKIGPMTSLILHYFDINMACDKDRPRNLPLKVVQN